MTGKKKKKKKEETLGVGEQKMGHNVQRERRLPSPPPTP